MNAQLFLLLQCTEIKRLLKIWKKSEKDHQKQIKFKQVQLKM